MTIDNDMTADAQDRETIPILYGFQARTADGQWSGADCGVQDASNLLTSRAEAEAEIPALAETLGCAASDLRVVEWGAR